MDKHDHKSIDESEESKTQNNPNYRDIFGTPSQQSAQASKRDGEISSSILYEIEEMGDIPKQQQVVSNESLVEQDQSRQLQIQRMHIDVENLQDDLQQAQIDSNPLIFSAKENNNGRHGLKDGTQMLSHSNFEQPTSSLNNRLMSVTSVRTNLFNNKKEPPSYINNKEEDAVVIDDIEGLGLKISTHIDPFKEPERQDDTKWYESMKVNKRISEINMIGYKSTQLTKVHLQPREKPSKSCLFKIENFGQSEQSIENESSSSSASIMIQSCSSQQLDQIKQHKITNNEHLSLQYGSQERVKSQTSNLDKSQITSQQKAIKILKKGMLSKSRMMQSGKSLILMKKRCATEAQLDEITTNKARSSNQLQKILTKKYVDKAKKLQVSSEENKKLIAQHKLRMFSQDNFLLKALKMKREQDTGVQKEEEIDLAEYHKELYQQEEVIQEKQKEGHIHDCFIISPFSRKLLIFDFFTCNLVVYDIIMVPFKNTFGQDIFTDRVKSILNIFDITTKFFFAIDVILGFRKAFVVEKTGKLEKCPYAIAKSYLKFYFWIDVLSAMPFDLFVDSGILRYSSLVKFFRLFRLKKIVAHMRFKAEVRAKIRIFYLVAFLIWVVHLVTCYFYYIVVMKQHQQKRQEINDLLQSVRYNFDYWMPQVDLNDQKTDFYDLTLTNKYIMVSYYALLLVIGNDVCAQSPEEMTFCSLVLVIGAFLVATIFGGIASENAAVNDKRREQETLLDYVYYSLEIHKIESKQQKKIVNYVQKVDDTIAAKKDLIQFLEFINPHMKYLVMTHFHFAYLREFWMFEKSQENELMFIAENMQAQIFMQDERVVYQGEVGNMVFILIQGSVDVELRQRADEQFQASVQTMMKVKQMFKRQKKKKNNNKDAPKKLGFGLLKGLFKKEKTEVVVEKKEESSEGEFDCNAFQDKLQMDNKHPMEIKSQKNEMANIFSFKEDSMVNKDQHRKIDILTKGDMFGEIATLSNLRRTCSVTTRENCVFQTISKYNMDRIQKKFPSIFSNIRGEMLNYQDEDMTLRCQFVHNIPFLRGLDQEVIMEIVYLMKQDTFDIGDYVLRQKQNFDSIIILWEGLLQARVSRSDYITQELKDYWFDTLEKGACIGVYSSWVKEWTSLLNYIVCSKNVVIYTISIEELIHLSKKIIPLRDRLEKIKLRIQNHEVDDLDYFTFPKKFMEKNLVNKTDDIIRKERKKFVEKKQIIKKQMYKFVANVLKGTVRFPRAVDLLVQIREDRKVQQTDADILDNEAQALLKQGFDLKGIYKNMKQKKFKDFIYDIDKKIQQFESIQELNTPSSIVSGQTSNLTIKSVSFQSEKHKQKEMRDPMPTRGSLAQYGASMTQIDESSDSVSSSAGQRYKKKIQQELKKDINCYKKLQIQIKNGVMLLKKVLNEDGEGFFIDIFLNEIEKLVCTFRNFELFQQTLTKEKDETYKFKNMMIISNNNLQSIFQNININNLQCILDLIYKQQFIIERTPGAVLELIAQQKPDLLQISELKHKEVNKNPSGFSSFQIESYEGGGKVNPSIVIDGESPNNNRIVLGQNERSETSSSFQSESIQDSTERRRQIQELDLSMDEVVESGSFTSQSFQDSGTTKQKIENSPEKDSDGSESLNVEVDLENDEKYQNWVYSEKFITQFMYYQNKLNQQKSKLEMIKQLQEKIEAQETEIKAIQNGKQAKRKRFPYRRSSINARRSQLKED